MDLREINEKKLAELFSKSPYYYNNLVQGLQALQGRKILPDKLEKLLPEAIALIERVNSVARNSDYFMFKVYDSWAKRTDAFFGGDGYSVYQKVGEEMVRHLGVGTGSPPQLEYATNFLKKKKVKRIFTLEIGLEDYYGIKAEEDHLGGDIVENKILDENDILELNKKGIEVIVLTP